MTHPPRPIGTAALTGLIVALVCGLGTPSASAEPAPDLTGYHQEDPKDFGGYYTYPTTNGLQFSTPGGYRCRITYTGRANPPYKGVGCWGALPGTSFNSVYVGLGIEARPADFANADLTKFEIYHDWQHPTEDVQVAPDSYRPLSAGSKVTYPGSGTCSATATTTTCVLGDHGFVLDPSGSRAF